MIRVVLDTNVFISSFFGGNPRKIIDRWRSGQVVLCLSKPIVDEYVEVLRRLGLQKEKELEELLRIFSLGVNVLFSARTPAFKIVKEDPDDDKFIECAVALKADVIVTGDKHLAAVEDYMGIRIVTPAGFLKAWRDK